jgi:hypothetical protein
MAGALVEFVEMTKHYSLTAYRDAGDIEVTYTITAGRPAIGPSYASGGEPAEPPEVELIEVKIDGVVHAETEFDDWLINYILENHEDDGPDPDDARDRMQERYV